MDIGYITDKGKIRENNEDSCLADGNSRIFIVADGVGGQNAGEIASGIAIEEISGYLKANLSEKRSSEKHIFRCINEGMKRANDKIISKSLEDESFSKMATTAVVLVIRKGVAYISNIGDSRAYLLRDGRLKKLTEDHTMANKLVREGKLTEEEVEFLAQKQLVLNMFSTITRALGDVSGVEADNFTVKIEADDQFILCTDGLYGEVENEKIAEIVLDADTSQDACGRLSEAANMNGGRDNITAIIIKIGVDDYE